MDATVTPVFVGGFGPIETALSAIMVAMVVGVVWVVAKRAVTDSLPGYKVNAERVGDETVKATVTGVGTAAKIQFVVDGEVRAEVDAKPDASAVFEVEKDENLSVRKLGGN